MLYVTISYLFCAYSHSMQACRTHARILASARICTRYNLPVVQRTSFSSCPTFSQHTAVGNTKPPLSSATHDMRQSGASYLALPIYRPCFRGFSVFPSSLPAFRVALLGWLMCTCLMRQFTVFPSTDNLSPISAPSAAMLLFASPSSLAMGPCSRQRRKTKLDYWLVKF
jgi:hypothetical protein